MRTAPDRSANRTAWFAFPKPLIRDVYRMEGDRAKVFLRLLELAVFERQVVDGYVLQPGECLISTRSEPCWGGIRFDRKPSADARRNFIRRTLKWLEKNGFISTREARQSGPPAGPLAVVDLDPSPTIVRLLRFREVSWPEGRVPARPEVPAAARSTAHPTGPIEPVDQPVQPEAAASGLEPVGLDQGEVHEHAPAANDFPLTAEFQDAMALRFGAKRVRTTTDLGKWAAMEAEVRRVGLVAAVIACVERASRRREGMNAIGSLWWFLPCLRELPTAAEQPAALPPGNTDVGGVQDCACAEWANALGLLRETINHDVLSRWMVPLKARRQSDTLVLLAPNRFDRDFITDNYVALFEQALAASNPDHAPLRVVIRSPDQEQAHA